VLLNFCLWYERGRRGRGGEEGEGERGRGGEEREGEKRERI
jgi:hypothetical protein